MKRMRSNNITIKLATICIALVIAFGAVGLVIATPSPNGHGQPGAPGTSCGTANADQTPGNSAFSPGSPFNEPIPGVSPGGIGGQNYAGNKDTPGITNHASDHAISQYDIACFEVTTNSNGVTNPCPGCDDAILGLEPFGFQLSIPPN